jgi:hypothetical protein
MSAKGAKRPNRSPNSLALARSEQEVTAFAIDGSPRSNNLARTETP